MSAPDSRGRSDVLAELRITIAPAYSDYDDEVPANRAIAESRLQEFGKSSELTAVVKFLVAERLGPEFEARAIRAEKGSLEIVALIVLVGKVATNYLAVRDGLMAIIRDCGRVLGPWLPHVSTYDYNIAARYSAQPLLEQLAESFPGDPRQAPPTLATAPLGVPPWPLWLPVTLVLVALLVLLLVVVLVQVL
jgi:hypothetical protein